jgi:hypothetical protein
MPKIETSLSDKINKII